VLIVDDDTDLRDSLSDALGLEDYVVLVCFEWQGSSGTAADLEEALVLDIFMPIMNGTQFYQEIRATPAWANIPAMIWTSDPAQAPRRAGDEKAFHS
jgi:DNA-binding response OmpR family regulator